MVAVMGSLSWSRGRSRGRSRSYITGQNSLAGTGEPDDAASAEDAAEYEEAAAQDPEGHGAARRDVPGEGLEDPAVEQRVGLGVGLRADADGRRGHDHDAAAGRTGRRSRKGVLELLRDLLLGGGACVRGRPSISWWSGH